MELKAESIEMNIDGKEILRGINVLGQGNEFVGVIGPNGSGKSTVLKIMYRVLKPTKGAIFMEGHEFSYLPLKESGRKMAVVSQHNHCNFDFTVQEMVLMGRSPHKRVLERDNANDYQIVADVIGKVGMSDFIKRQFSSLSGGEQQRIILARALAQEPKVLVLDEPTNHLDIKYQFQLLNTVKGLGILVIAAFHDLNIAALYCDRIYALKEGMVIREGKTEDVLTPETIKRLYDVDSTVTKDQYGNVSIAFKPS